MIHRGKNSKKLAAVALAGCMVLGVLPAAGLTESVSATTVSETGKAATGEAANTQGEAAQAEETTSDQSSDAAADTTDTSTVTETTSENTSDEATTDTDDTTGAASDETSSESETTTTEKQETSSESESDETSSESETTEKRETSSETTETSSEKESEATEETSSETETTEKQETSSESETTEKQETSSETETTEDTESESTEDTETEATEDTETEATEDTETEATEDTETEATEDTESVTETEEDTEELLRSRRTRYEGIVIDGDFSDWDPVAKTSVNEGKGWSTVDEVAMVWDGDYVYLYFMSNGNGDGTGDWGSVTGAGPYNNGQYVITTDLGYQLLIQLTRNNNGSVSGVDGAAVAVNNTDWMGAPHMWEVAIPSSALPSYKSTISFGIYQSQTLISDVANLQGTDDGTDKEFHGIVYDGSYGDWEYYPHTLIQYATAGTHENVVDAQGALYSTNGLLYAHVVTSMPAHLQEAGGEFTSGVTIRLNGDSGKDFYPQFVAVDAQGNINYSPQLSGLAYGTYEFYMIDATGWKSATNISEITEKGNAVYGRMYVTIGASEDNMEFEFDLKLLAEKFGISADEIRTVSAQWGRIGQQWVTTAGTSTGTWLGLLICFAGVGGAYYVQRKRKKQVF